MSIISGSPLSCALKDEYILLINTEVKQSDCSNAYFYDFSGELTSKPSIKIENRSKKPIFINYHHPYIIII